jgi:kojibiose phosphorylase
LTEVLVFEWDEAAGVEALASRLRRLLVMGVDVVVLVAGPPDAVARALASCPDGPGRLMVLDGSDRPAEPVAWARRRLLGGSGPDDAVVTAVTSDLDALVSAAEGMPHEGTDASWALVVEGLDTRRERDIESWMAVGNGRTGTRGSLEEGGPASFPALYVAGVFGRAPGDELGPQLLRGPEWPRLRPRAGDEDVRPDPAADDNRRVLDMREGTVLRSWRRRPPGDGWTFRSARFASLADRALLGLEAEAGRDSTPVDLSGDVPVPDDQDAVKAAETATESDRTFVTLKGHDGREAAYAIATSERGGRIERLVAVARAGLDGSADAALTAAQVQGLRRLRGRHRREWRDRWADADVVVTGDADAQRALRFSLYHLISAGDPESDVASIGARAMTGPGYRGHVFWDTDVFVLPFFVWTHPPTARALLAYRYRTLPAARAKAESMGYRGALFAWESADAGDDVTPAYADLRDGTRLRVLTGLQEHHISADVAWAAWHYWQATADADFLTNIGAEIILETARFWASRVTPGQDGRYHVKEVIGPDEYHEGVDDNAYTNVMARWNLHTAVELCVLLPTLDPVSWQGLVGRIDLTAAETRQWGEVAAGLVDGFDPATGLYEQFAGFFKYDDVRAVDLDVPRPFTAEIVLGIEQLRHTQMVKQADVLMLAQLLPDHVSAEVARANYDYYEPRTCHGSSLSPAVHAAVAARVGALDDAKSYFDMAASIDLADGMGNAALGVHVATMGGLWQAAVFGFGGVRSDGDALRIDPRLPPSWDALAFPVRWRGTRVRLEVTSGAVHLDVDAPTAVALGTAAPAALQAGRFVAQREGDGWSALRLADAR